MTDDLTKLRAELRQLVLSASWQDKEWGFSMPVDEVAAILDALDAAEMERDEAQEIRAHDIARLTTIIAFLRKRRGNLVIERDEARAAEKLLHDRLRCLEDAVDQCLDDMGKHGHSVCGAAKAQLRHALGPDYLTDDERHISYVEAVRILIECDELHGKRSSLRDELAQIEDRTPPKRRKLGHDINGKSLKIIEPHCGQCVIDPRDGETWCVCGKQPGEARP